jgi:adenine phosphoribosyltransferase
MSATSEYRIALLSKSEIKFNALFNLVESKLKKELNLTSFSITKIEGNDKTDQIEQPIDWKGGYGAARNRFQVVLKENPDLLSQFDLIVIMENYMDYHALDLVVIIFYDVKHDIEYRGCHPCARVRYDSEYYTLFVDQVLSQQTHKWGSPITFGSLLNRINAKIPANDWMSVVTGKTRQKALEEGLVKMSEKFIHDNKLKRHILTNVFTTHENFPKPGVNFKDWSNIWLNPHLVSKMIDMVTDIFDGSLNTKHGLLNDIYPRPKIDYVVGLESRGIWFATPLALKLQCGMVPVRKPGKIPGPILSESYQKEYGSDTIEIRNDLPSGNVLIVDDILATGGSLMAAIKLVERAGHKVIGCAVISDVPELREKAQSLLGNYLVHVLLKL